MVATPNWKEPLESQTLGDGEKSAADRDKSWNSRALAENGSQKVETNASESRKLASIGLIPDLKLELQDFTRENHADLDLDGNGYISKNELDRELKDDLLSRGLSARDRKMVATLRTNLDAVENLSNDEWGRENNGISIKDAGKISELDHLDFERDDPLKNVPKAKSPAASSSAYGPLDAAELLYRNFSGLDLDADGYLEPAELKKIESSRLWSKALDSRDRRLIDEARERQQVIADSHNDEIGCEDRGITRSDLKHFELAEKGNLKAVPDQPGDYLKEVVIGNDRRTYRMHIPESYSAAKARGEKVPMMIFLHPLFGNAGNGQSIAEMTTKADKEGFIVVYPNGHDWFGDNRRAWNIADLPNPKNNDVDFVRDIIDTTTERLAVDPGRVYVAGYSNGAILAHEVATKLSDRITAIAAVSGAMTGLEKPPADPVSVLTINSTADSIIRYQGRNPWPNRLGLPTTRSVEYTKDFWARADRLQEVSVSNPASGVKLERYASSAGGSAHNSPEVEIYTIEGGNHAYPGGEYKSMFGRPPENIKATDVIWNFFKTKRKEEPMVISA